MKLIIIGGGIAGLSAAYYALKNTPETQITLLEASDRWGGKITTDRVSFDDGIFIIEGGPDTFLATKSWAVSSWSSWAIRRRSSSWARVICFK